MPKRITELGVPYFVTLRVNGWVDIFTRPRYAKVIFDSLTYCIVNHRIKVYGFCLMSNHLHMIATAQDDLNYQLGCFKSYTSNLLLDSVFETGESRTDWMQLVFKYHGLRKYSRGMSLWRYSNHPICVTHPQVFYQKLDYIHNNPVKSGFVLEPEHYFYSSACEMNPLRKYLCSAYD